MKRTQREEEEFAAFAEAAWAPLYRRALLLLGDYGQAEDLTQTALAKAYVHWRRLRSPDAAFGYTKAIMLNEARALWRQASWGREWPTADLPDGRVSDDPALRPAVLDALRELAPRQRAAIVLRYYEDLTVEQTARALGCAVGTVKSQTSDALAKLRLLLGDPALEDATSEGQRHD
ncbi:MAG: SigE family RNA polymerase sigma factor [Nocardioides sp.]|uniref:SigE family RNA polymerase sigma factor n=1 Tax=Nocardioides sp. TaxID=35761 RepID=UPI0039E56428